MAGNTDTSNPETDFRLSILNTFLRTPHGDLESVLPLFVQVHSKDPLFFGRLACWYASNGNVRDLRELFIAFMCASDFDPSYREAGLALLIALPPYQVANVLQILKGKTSGDKFSPGIANSVPRSFRKAVEMYLRDREQNHEQFDNVALHARKSLKTLYASLRIKPGPYAQAILFDDNPPAESKLGALKRIANTQNPTEQAALIVEHKIPFRVASSLLKHLTPAAVAALVSSMSPQEVINNLASLKRRGALDNPDLLALIESKVEAAKTDKRVSALKSKRALQAVNLSEDLVRKVESVADTQIKTKGVIGKSTAVLVDKSGSMEVAIAVGKEVAAIVAPVCQNELYVYAFDTAAYPIVAKGKELSDWDKAFKGINAFGGTSCGVAIKTMERRNQRVDQIVIITDQGENTAPRMAAALKDYAAVVNSMPNVVIVNVGTYTDQVERELKETSVEVDSYVFDGDYYSLPNLIPLLAGGSRFDLLLSIMETQLPVRKGKQVSPV